ncbi:PAXIP1-associated protein-like protein [Sarcoptes scabiei]|uniref:PAXIP1-associated protein-like protein n=1 Tax=Sarcoptes scabiei TaxID=52283 RepID=A0A132AG29_SARSC|nr:PAXIP1-associated protein-like protein [Sarcoptes scabiei]
MDFLAECSDEEQFFDPNEKYRQLKIGSRTVRIWEPSGSDIANLYEEIKEKGVVDLEWQCPGRISPTEYDSMMNAKSESPNTSSTDQTQADKTEFDFDNDFDDETNPIETKSQVMRKNYSADPMKKSQTTNLTKVMQDIKKYQLMDH